MIKRPVASSLTLQREGGGGGVGGLGVWDMNDWEMGSMVDFFHVLESNTPLTDNGDQLR